MNGKVTAIYISPIAGGQMKHVEIVKAIAGAGLEGDRYCAGEGSFNKGRPGKRQVTLINKIFLKTQSSIILIADATLLQKMLNLCGL